MPGSSYTGTASVLTLLGGTVLSAPIIDEVQMPAQISRGATGGPTFSTTVTVAATGAESRISMWRAPRHRWDITHGSRNAEQGSELVAFFNARNGRGRGFRFKDWNDYKLTNEPLTVTGSKLVQVTKRYTSGPVTLVRNIYKPQTNLTPFTLRRNTIAYTTFTLDVTTGLITLTADSVKTITGITQASSAVISATAHGFSVGNIIYIEGVSGMTEINGQTVTITATTTNTFTVSLNTTSYTAYASGGTASKYIQPSEQLDCSGEYDVPVRFDIDEMNLTMTDSEIRDWNSVPVVELIS